MVPPTPQPSRQSVPSTGQSRSARHGIQAARGLPPVRDHIRNTHNRIDQAMSTLNSTRHALYELETHHRSIVEAKDAEIANLQQRFSDLNTLHRTTKARIDEKVEDQGRLHTELKTLKKELAAEKANKGVTVEDVGKQIVEVKQKNAMLSAKVLGLEKELADERARGTANRDAKRELEVMKTKLADMVSGAKVKVEMIE